MQSFPKIHMVFGVFIIIDLTEDLIYCLTSITKESFKFIDMDPSSLFI